MSEENKENGFNHVKTFTKMLAIESYNNIAGNIMEWLFRFLKKFCV